MIVDLISIRFCKGNWSQNSGILFSFCDATITNHEKIYLKLPIRHYINMKCFFAVDYQDDRKNEATISLTVFTFVYLTLENMKSLYFNCFCVCLTFVYAISIFLLFLFMVKFRVGEHDTPCALEINQGDGLLLGASAHRVTWFSNLVVLRGHVTN